MPVLRTKSLTICASTPPPPCYFSAHILPTLNPFSSLHSLLPSTPSPLGLPPRCRLLDHLPSASLLLSPPVLHPPYSSFPVWAPFYFSSSPFSIPLHSPVVAYFSTYPIIIVQWEMIRWHHPPWDPLSVIVQREMISLTPLIVRYTVPDKSGVNVAGTTNRYIYTKTPKPSRLA